MRVVARTTTVRELVAGYEDESKDPSKETNAVTALGGALNVRPPYQRSFVYSLPMQQAVIDSVLNEFPLGAIYWVDKGDGTFEMLDGQQRTLSLASFVAGDFSVVFGGNRWGFGNLPTDLKDRLLSYPLTVYTCSGPESELMEWFERINIPGLALTNQERRNAIYHGPWLTDAQSYFSVVGGPGATLADGLVHKRVNRQELLETAIAWYGLSEGHDSIEETMIAHQHDEDAGGLFTHFESVIRWVHRLFPPETTSEGFVFRSEMRRVDWGGLHHETGGVVLDPVVLGGRVEELLLDDDVTAKSGIYPFLLTGDLKHLSLRPFPAGMRHQAYEAQGGRCAAGTRCLTPGNSDGERVFPLSQMEADHIVPWVEGGATVKENLQLLCKRCNRTKGSR